MHLEEKGIPTCTSICWSVEGICKSNDILVRAAQACAVQVHSARVASAPPNWELIDLSLNFI